MVVASLVAVGVSAARLQPAPHPDLETEAVTAAMCAECHADALEQMVKGGHAGLAGHCPLCHDLKAAEPPYVRLAGAQICDKCHRLAIQPGSPAPQTIEIAPGVVAAHELLPIGRQVRLDERLRGHPVSNHPVANVPDPLHAGRQLSCRTCHLAHGTRRRLLAFDLKPGENICKKCHDL